MAIAIIEVTKEAVNLETPGVWSITLRLRCLTDDPEPIVAVDAIFTERYRQGYEIPALKQRYLLRMQDAINNWKSENNVFNHAKLDTLVSDLENSLES